MDHQHPQPPQGRRSLRERLELRPARLLHTAVLILLSVMVGLVMHSVQSQHPITEVRLTPLSQLVPTLMPYAPVVAVYSMLIIIAALLSLHDDYSHRPMTQDMEPVGPGRHLDLSAGLIMCYILPILVVPMLTAAIVTTFA